MAASWASIVGFTAGLLTTISFTPQVVKTFRSRSAGDISIGMYLLLALGIVLWLVHGLLVGSAPVVVANAVTLLLVAAMLVMKIRFK